MTAIFTNSKFYTKKSPINTTHLIRNMSNDFANTRMLKKLKVK